MSEYINLYMNLFPTLGMGLLDSKFISSPRPELFSSPGILFRARPTPHSSLGSPTHMFLECAQPQSPWSAQPQSLSESPRVPNVRYPRSVPTRVCLECPTPESAWSAQPQNLLQCPTPECPAPESPCSAPLVPNPKVSRTAQPQSVQP